jgi:hypothetical protein
VQNLARELPGHNNAEASRCAVHHCQAQLHVLVLPRLHRLLLRCLSLLALPVNHPHHHCCRLPYLLLMIPSPILQG